MSRVSGLPIRIWSRSVKLTGLISPEFQTTFIYANPGLAIRLPGINCGLSYRKWGAKEKQGNKDMLNTLKDAIYVITSCNLWCILYKQEILYKIFALLQKFTFPREFISALT